MQYPKVDLFKCSLTHWWSFNDMNQRSFDSESGSCFEICPQSEKSRMEQVILGIEFKQMNQIHKQAKTLPQNTHLSLETVWPSSIYRRRNVFPTCNWICADPWLRRNRPLWYEQRCQSQLLPPHFVHPLVSRLCPGMREREREASARFKSTYLSKTCQKLQSYYFSPL